MLVKLEAYRDGKSWCARGIGVSIFTQGQSFEGLLENVEEAVALHFKEQLEQGETLQVLIQTETEVKGKFHVHGPQKSSSPLPDDEIARRKKLAERILARRAHLPPLGMTTAELVRLARQGLESYDAS